MDKSHCYSITTTQSICLIHRRILALDCKNLLSRGGLIVIWLRFALLVTSIVEIVAGAIAAFFGPWTLPYDVRGQMPISWAVDSPGYAVAVATAVLIGAMLWRPGRTVYVKDFSA